MEKPDYHDLVNKLAPIASKWNEIGLGLRVDTDLLDSLRASHKSGSLKLADVLDNWIKMNGDNISITWKTILDVVKGPLIQNNNLAAEIHESLQESTRQQIVTREYKI